MEQQEPFDIDVTVLRRLIQREALAEHERRLARHERWHLLALLAMLLLGAALLGILVLSRAHA